MIAMELSGVHIGKTVKITFRKSSKSKTDTIDKVKIQVVQHEKTTVALKRRTYSYGRYVGNNWVVKPGKRYKWPTLAEVEFLD